MKNNIVFWGADELDRRILVAARLRAKDNKVDFWTFPEKQVNAAFADKMFGDWEELEPSEFPEGYVHIERDISSSELLPENIKTDNTELVMRAEKEWFVKVLVQRLYEMLDAEVSALHEQVMSLTEYDKTLWDSCKNYWEKIMSHNQERNITRDQAIELRGKVNASFERLKGLLDNTNKAYEEEAQANFFQINKRLEEIKQELEKNPNGSRNVFNQLKQIQEEAKVLKLNRPNRNEIFNTLNELFESSKNISRSSVNEKINHRIAGLEDAIHKMQKSLDFDLRDVEYINKRNNSSSVSQLEFKLSKAKLDMLQHKIDSKKVKLDEMNKLLLDLKKEVQKTTIQPASAEKSTKDAAKTNPAAGDGKRTHKPIIRSEKVEIKGQQSASNELVEQEHDQDQLADKDELPITTPDPNENIVIAETIDPAESMPVEVPVINPAENPDLIVNVEDNMEKDADQPSQDSEADNNGEKELV